MRSGVAPSATSSAVALSRLRILKSALPRFNLVVAKPLPVFKATDSIYSTAAHRSWRTQVKQRAGYRCEWILQDGSRCNVREAKMYADHVVEVRDGGALHDLSNGMCLCASHHTIKTVRVSRERKSWTDGGGVGG